MSSSKPRRGRRTKLTTFLAASACTTVGATIYFALSNSQPEYDPQGFNSDGIHEKTGTLYDPYGYNRYGFDKDSFNREGIHKYTDIPYDSYGFSREGIHRCTDTLYDLAGFNRYGIHEDTGTLYNPDGYDRDGKHEDEHRHNSSGGGVIYHILPGRYYALREEEDKRNYRGKRIMYNYN